MCVCVLRRVAFALVCVVGRSVGRFVGWFIRSFVGVSATLDPPIEEEVLLNRSFWTGLAARRRKAAWPCADGFASPRLSSPRVDQAPLDSSRLTRRGSTGLGSARLSSSFT